MHRLALLALTACASPPALALDLPVGGEAVDVHEVATEMVPEPAPSPYSVESQPLAPAAGTLAAAPGDNLVAVAATDDGVAAATLDNSGSLRFWPTLDGTREPVIVRARRATVVALGRDDDAFAIATLDGLGQLELVRVSSTGATLGRLDVDAPRPFVELVATSVGFVARRDDGVIVWLGANGVSHGELGMVPGGQIEQLVTRHDRVLAIVERGGARHGRWLELGDGGLAWGRATPQLPIGAGRVALLPDGDKLFATLPLDGGFGNHDATVLSLATGASLATPEPAQYTEAIGVMDATNLFFERNDGLALARGDDIVHLPLSVRREPVVVTDRGLVTLGATSLAVVTDRVRWLGYQLTTISDLMPVGDGGWLATNGSPSNASVVHLDAALHIDRSYAPPSRGWSYVQLIDSSHVVNRPDEYRLVDIENNADDPVVLAKAMSFDFERSTNLAALRRQGEVVFMHYDPAAHAFGTDMAAEWWSETVQVELDDPASTGGIVAVIGGASLSGDGKHAEIVVEQLRRVDPRHHELTVARRTATTVVAPADGDFPAMGSAMPPRPHVRHSPDGELVAELVAGRVSVRRADGTPVWTHAAAGARGLVWLAPNELLLFGEGIARIDARTGAPRARQCGWRFGAWDVATSDGAGAGLCEAW